jgi:hypothetical protein
MYIDATHKRIALHYSMIPKGHHMQLVLRVFENKVLQRIFRSERK